MLRLGLCHAKVLYPSQGQGQDLTQVQTQTKLGRTTALTYVDLILDVPSWLLVWDQATIVDGGPGFMAKIFGVFGTKTCSFIKETVLCSKHDEKLEN